MKRLLRIGVVVNLLFGVLYVLAYVNKMVSIKYEFEDPTYGNSKLLIESVYRSNNVDMIMNAVLVIVNLNILTIVLVELTKQKEN